MKSNIFKSGLFIALVAMACHTNKSEDPTPSGGTTDTSHPPSATVTTVAGTDTKSGYSEGQGLSSQFLYPGQMVFDKDDNLYIIDQRSSYIGGSMIRKMTPSGDVSTFAKGFGAITDICIDPRDGVTLYATESGDKLGVPAGIFKITSAGQISRLNGGPGLSGYEDGPLATAKFASPRSLVMDNSGNLYIGDALNYCVRKVNLETQTVTTLAGKAPVNTAICHYLDGTGVNAEFCTFEDLVLDDKGNIILPDWGNNRVRKIAPNGTVSTYINSGIGGFYKEGPIESAGVQFPYLCCFNQKTKQILISTGTGASLDIVTPNNYIFFLSRHIVKNDYAANSNPGYFGIAVNSKGEVFVADQYSHCIRRLTITW